jgi:hypothetical protein
MEEGKEKENRFRVNIQGDKRITDIEIRIPTFWLWVAFVLVLASQFPNLYTILQQILGN